ncbi:hypothetical protein Tco_1102897 [Tanacetum coccineum]
MKKPVWILRNPSKGSENEEIDQEEMSAVKDKGKAIMQETEPPKKIKKRETIQIGHNEELAQKLHAEELAKIEEETVQKEDVIPEQVMKESSRKAEGRLKRKASKAREDKDKRQKKQDDPEKLMEYVEVISDSEEVISVTPLAVKSPVVGEDSFKQGRIDANEADENYYPALDEMKSIKPKKKRVVIQELSESTTTISSQLSSQQSQEKKAKIDDDHQLAESMQAQEQD